MTMNFRHLPLWILILSTSVMAEDESGSVSLTEMAQQADLVAVAQVVDTDYIYTRSFPSEGTAILKTLISYKSPRKDEEYIEVYEKGLHQHECYFETPEFFLEGRRYLVFFKLDEDDPELYRGLAQGCALEILVAENNTYALRYPADGFAIADELESLVRPYNFKDQNALVDDESISPSDRDDLIEGGWIATYNEQFKYTHGIDLTTVRRLIGNEALKDQARP